ncbi:MAG: D-threonate 4-phosphate dehydrogenase [Isosphaeraceae bacterium]
MNEHAPPLLALTMGDVAGVGPELIAAAWANSPLQGLARPFIIGSRTVLERALDCVGARARIQSISRPEDALPSSSVIPCLEGTAEDVASVPPGQVDARAGRAARDYLVAAIDLALTGRIDAITTLPLNKESLHAGGILLPGHTEILAERCAVDEHAMMLYLPGTGLRNDTGLGVVHVTLHVSLRESLDLITQDAIASKIVLADRAMRPLTGGSTPRVAVAALNPHAGEGGLFGDEESRIIVPAILQARALGVDVVGPIAADTLFVRAFAGEFDTVVVMYHDQGHIALKTHDFHRAVNVTLGLPIVRTSVAHGTAYDIAWQGKAETTSLIEAVRVAARIVLGRRILAQPRPAGFNV